MEQGNNKCEGVARNYVPDVSGNPWASHSQASLSYPVLSFENTPPSYGNGWEDSAMPPEDVSCVKPGKIDKLPGTYLSNSKNNGSLFSSAPRSTSLTDHPTP